MNIDSILPTALNSKQDNRKNNKKIKKYNKNESDVMTNNNKTH
jgi:hypothetical protein